MHRSIIAKGCTKGVNSLLKIIFVTGLVISMVMPALALNHYSVYAQSITPQDLISAVNQMRAAQGLPAYVVNSDLNEFAQLYSDYAVAGGCDKFNHIRSDGSYAYYYRISENLDCGSNLTIADVLKKWNNTLNLYTLTGIPYGRIGVGITISGDTVFVVLDIKEDSQPTNSLTPSVNVVTKTSTPNATLFTSTPLPDGSVWHVVGNGQSVLQIAQAYGITQSELQSLNELNSSVYLLIGQRLLIRTGNPPTQTPTATLTIQPTQAAATFTPSLTQSTKLSKQTPSPTITDTLENGQTSAPNNISGASLIQGQYFSTHQLIGLILVTVCGIGLIVMGIWRLISLRR